MARKLKNQENEKSTLYDLEYGKKKKKEQTNKKNILRNLDNEKCTQQDLEYGEKTEKHGKLEMLTVRPG